MDELKKSYIFPLLNPTVAQIQKYEQIETW